MEDAVIRSGFLTSALPATSVRLALLLVSVVCIIGVGCSNSSVSTLVDSLRMGNENRLTTIDQLDLTQNGGLLSPQQVTGAKLIKRVQLQPQLEAFAKALSTASEGVQWANHPVTIKQFALRVETTGGTWFIFCDVQTSAGRTNCIVTVGEAGETNINRMKRYESDELPAWFRENLIEPK
jgi:hypothetical protein